VHAFLVPVRDDAGNARPGVTISDCGVKAGLNGVDNGRLVFDHVRVPREALLDRFGSVAPDGTYSSPIDDGSRRFFTMLGTLVRGRISVAGGAGSAAEKALALACATATPAASSRTPRRARRSSSGLPRPPAQAAAAARRSYALHVAQNDLVERMHELQSPALDDERAQRELETRAAGIKAIGTWHATRAIQTCREACGGGLPGREPAARRSRPTPTCSPRSRATTPSCCSSSRRRCCPTTARRVGRLDPLGRRGSPPRSSATPWWSAPGCAPARPRRRARPGRAAPPARRPRGAPRRERRAAGAQGLAPGADRFAVFNGAQDHLLAAARAHVERIVFDSFAPMADRHPLLGGCSSCTACRWWTPTGRGSSSTASSVRAARRRWSRAVNELCAELRPHARELVDAFGIPERWLACPMLDGEHGAAAPVEAGPAELAAVG
jgi:acyl-CoA oxidase